MRKNRNTYRTSTVYCGDVISPSIQLVALEVSVTSGTEHLKASRISLAVQLTLTQEFCV